MGARAARGGEATRTATGGSPRNPAHEAWRLGDLERLVGRTDVATAAGRVRESGTIAESACGRRHPDPTSPSSEVPATDLHRDDNQTERVLTATGDIGGMELTELRTRVLQAFDGGEFDLLLDARQVTSFDDAALPALTAGRSRAKYLRRRLAVLEHESVPACAAAACASGSRSTPTPPRPTRASPWSEPTASAAISAPVPRPRRPATVRAGQRGHPQVGEARRGLPRGQRRVTRRPLSSAAHHADDPRGEPEAGYWRCVAAPSRRTPSRRETSSSPPQPRVRPRTT